MPGHDWSGATGPVDAESSNAKLQRRSRQPEPMRGVPRKRREAWAKRLYSKPGRLQVRCRGVLSRAVSLPIESRTRGRRWRICQAKASFRLARVRGSSFSNRSPRFSSKAQKRSDINQKKRRALMDTMWSSRSVARAPYSAARNFFFSSRTIKRARCRAHDPTPRARRTAPRVREPPVRREARPGTNRHNGVPGSDV